jgi:hypothetical protein
MTTEVAGNPLAGHVVLSAHHYEAGPPANVALDVVSKFAISHFIAVAVTAESISVPG